MESFGRSGGEVERITQAAIRFGDEIYQGNMHATAALALSKIHPEWWKQEVIKPIDGFITSTGRFVSRDEAGIVAQKAEQTKHSSALDSWNLEGSRPEGVDSDEEAEASFDDFLK